MGAIVLRGTECVHCTWLLFLVSLCTQKEGAHTVAHAAGLLCRTAFNVKSKPHSSRPRWAENLSFSIIWAAFRLHHYTPLLRFCLDKQKRMQSQHVGNSSSESLNEAPNLKMELAGEHSPWWILVYPQHAICLTVRDLWVLWTSLRSFPALTASHRGLSEPRPAPEAELETPWG